MSEKIGTTTPAERQQRIRDCLAYLAERGAYDIAFEAREGLLEDDAAARLLAERVASNVRLHANMAGLDVPPVDYPPREQQASTGMNRAD